LAQALAQMQDECNFRYPTNPLTWQFLPSPFFLCIR
jgi:hypothetical protein